MTTINISPASFLCFGKTSTSVRICVVNDRVADMLLHVTVKATFPILSLTCVIRINCFYNL